MEWIGRCLFALPMAEVERLSEKLGADELMDSWKMTGESVQHRLRGRAGQAGAHPAACRTAGACGAGKEVTVIGNRRHAEIWATPVWEARRAAVTDEQRAERLRALHI